MAASALEAGREHAEVLHIFDKLHAAEDDAEACAVDQEEHDYKQVEGVDAIPATQQPKHPPAQHKHTTQAHMSQCRQKHYQRCCLQVVIVYRLRT